MHKWSLRERQITGSACAFTQSNKALFSTVNSARHADLLRLEVEAYALSLLWMLTARVKYTRTKKKRRVHI